MGVQKTRLQKTNEISTGYDPINIDFKAQTDNLIDWKFLLFMTKAINRQLQLQR